MLPARFHWLSVTIQISCYPPHLCIDTLIFLCYHVGVIGKWQMLLLLFIQQTIRIGVLLT